MKVTVKVVGHAVEFFPGKKDHYELEFDEPPSITEVIKKLGVGRALVMAAIVDGKRRDFDYVPREEAEIGDGGHRRR